MSLASTFASNLAHLFGDDDPDGPSAAASPSREKPWTVTVCLLGPAQPVSGRFSNLDFSASNTSQPRVWH